MTKKKQQSQSEESTSEQYSSSNRELVFDPSFLVDLKYWVETDKKIALRLLSLVEEIRRNPFEGTGKPKRLKYQESNVWSRRLTQKDRIVYSVMEDRIDFLQARYHYDD